MTCRTALHCAPLARASGDCPGSQTSPSRVGVSADRSVASCCQSVRVRAGLRTPDGRRPIHGIVTARIVRVRAKVKLDEGVDRRGLQFRRRPAATRCQVIQPPGY